ncbi:MAG: hypothetical protein EPO30_08660 [Lysobacteraceae bacterium]|nr:MAG: hypothetical protein EPO30_08660 [Xanthomonadaceae bacterium]
MGLLLVGCGEPPADQALAPGVQNAGAPMDPVRTARHLAGARLAALSGDQEGVRRNAEAISEDMRRPMKIPDGGRPIDRESARIVARALPGVRSANWVDRHNLLVRVEGAALRSERTIDALCNRFEALGDTLAVVVHLQDAAAVRGQEVDTLSRNCQLAMGDHAFLQQPRKMDVLDPAMRAQQQANSVLSGMAPPSRQAKGDRAALEAIPEM